MTDDRWAETESGTVVRRYFHIRGANEEMRIAKEQGWEIREVKLNGEPIPINERGGLRWPWRTRLVRNRDGAMKLRAGGANQDGDWHPAGRQIKQTDVQVTYIRNREGIGKSS